jgi:hypothetical protein
MVSRVVSAILWPFDTAIGMPVPAGIPKNIARAQRRDYSCTRYLSIVPV